MKDFEILSAHAWGGLGQKFIDRSYYGTFKEGLDSELAFRFGDLADAAAFTYCGLYPVYEWPYQVSGYIELPWMFEWYVLSQIGERPSSIQLKPGSRVKFFSGIENIWRNFQRQADDSDESEMLDWELPTTKRGAIEAHCVLVLRAVNDGFRSLSEHKYDNAALSISNAHQSWSLLHNECESFTSGRSRGGKLRHINDPKSSDKALVKECWREWVREPNRYPSLAAFSRDMLEKSSHLAGDPQVIGRWVREWRRTDGG